MYNFQDAWTVLLLSQIACLNHCNVKRDPNIKSVRNDLKVQDPTPKFKNCPQSASSKG